MNKVGIINLGYGNLGSLYNALSTLSHNLIISNNYKELKCCDILVLPGIGSARIFSKKVFKTGLKNFILEHISQKKQLVAICLGFQYLFSHTTEDGGVEGLNIFPEKVVRVDPTRFPSSRTGWYFVSNTRKLGLDNNKSTFYFNHAYAVLKRKKKFNYVHGQSEDILAWLKKDNIIGLQFHPEKSQYNGKDALKFILGNKYA